MLSKFCSERIVFKMTVYNLIKQKKAYNLEVYCVLIGQFQPLRSFSCTALHILTVQNFTRN